MLQSEKFSAVDKKAVWDYILLAMAFHNKFEELGSGTPPIIPDCSENFGAKPLTEPAADQPTEAKPEIGSGVRANIVGADPMTGTKRVLARQRLHNATGASRLHSTVVGR